MPNTPLTDGIVALTTYANSVTGASDTTLSDAVATLASGYGSGGESWSWMGKNPTLVQTALDEKVYLKDTPFASWTPTDTSTKMSDTINLTSYSAGFSDYDYVAVYKCHTHFEYGEGVSNNAKLVDCYFSNISFIAKYYSNYTNIEAGTPNTATDSWLSQRVGLLYYNNGSLQFAASSYGYFIYTNPTTALTSSKITLKKPQMNARCSSTYFSTANASTVDMDNSYCEMKIELWQVDSGTSAFGNVIDTIHDMYIGNF